MKVIIANWKMNGLRDAGLELAQAVARHMRPGIQTEVVLCPPVTLLASIGSGLGLLPHPNPLPKGEGAGKPSPLGRGLGEGKILLGAQDCHVAEKGAYTGDVSAVQLKDIGCSHVIVGHSERRQQHGETNALVRQKAEAALKAGLTPIICVGESVEEREAGRHLAVLEAQIRESMPVGHESWVMGKDPRPMTHDSCPYIIAYEPVWAIGSGKTPTLAQISEAHKHIAKCLGTAITAPIVYGGSVKAGNAHDILHAQGVDGVLVGGASLMAVEFCAIIDAASRG